MGKSMLLLLLALVTVVSSSPRSVESLLARLKKRTSPPVEGCIEDGVSYRPGDPVPSGDCNSCFCAGRDAIACTMMMCPEPNREIMEKRTSEPIQGCSKDGVSYAPGDPVPSGDCNSCFCAGRDAIACTLMLCLDEPLGAIQEKRTSEPVQGCSKDGVSYAPGDPVPSGDCNSCFCAGRDAIACTLMLCVDEPLPAIQEKRTSEPVQGCRKDGVSYAPGDPVPSGDCNSCFCAGRDAIACTLMLCVDESPQAIQGKRTSEPVKGCIEDGVSYAPGDEVPTDDCNSCFCAGEDLRACTMMFCPEEDSRAVKGKRTSPPRGCMQDGVYYRPGASVPSSDCNSCFCAGNAVMCTMKSCLQQQQTCEYGGQTYSPGDVFDATDGCNACFCSAAPSGTAIGCTMMLCPEAKAKRTSPPRQPCEYNGQTYYSGDTFKSEDGCNNCFCAGPAVGCTQMAACRQALIDKKKRTSPPRPSCEYDGKTYYRDDTFPSVDGCNSCFCAGPAVGCTAMECPQVNNKKRTSEPRPYCLYNGEVYIEGESFDSVDGCNKCFCAAQDLVGCTAKFCPAQAPESRAIASKRTSEPRYPCTFDGKTYQSGEDWAAGDGCNFCFCYNGSVGCTEAYCEPKVPEE